MCLLEPLFDLHYYDVIKCECLLGGGCLTTSRLRRRSKLPDLLPQNFDKSLLKLV